MLICRFPTPVLDDGEDTDLLVDDSAVHLGHVKNERCLCVAARDETRVQRLQRRGFAGAHRVDLPGDLRPVELPPRQQLRNLFGLRGEGIHVEQEGCLLGGQGVDSGDEAVTQTLEAVLQGAAEQFVDDPGLGEATLDEALAFGGSSQSRV